MDYTRRKSAAINRTEPKLSTRAVHFRAADQFALDSVPILGTILDDLADKIGNLIQDLENAGEVLLASAGAQVATAIEYAKTAYIDALDTTIDKLTDVEQSVINDLTTEIAYIQNGVIAQVQQIITRG